MTDHPTVRTWVPKVDDDERGLVLLGGKRRSSYLPVLAAGGAGRCYELAFAYVAHHAETLTPDELSEARLRVVHGSIQGHPDLPRIGHAWAEFRHPDTGRWHVQDVGYHVHQTRARWNQFASPTRARTYAPDQAIDLAVSTVHTGPWHAAPFGYADCPHGLTPVDGKGRNPCPHGCLDDTLKEPKENP